MNEFISKLEHIGLTKTESRVYLFLTEYREAKTGLICSKLNIPSSRIYSVLEKLLEKGIVSYKLVNNVKIFRAVSAESLYALFQEKERQLEKEKKELQQFISTLKKIEVKDSKLSDFKYFEGIAGIKSMFSEYIESWGDEKEILVASAPLAYEKWNAFLLDMWHPVRTKRKILQKMIVPKRLKKRGKEREKFRPIELRYSKLEMEAEFSVCGEYTYFLSYGDKPYGLLIRDKNFADTQKKIFATLWANAKE